MQFTVPGIPKGQARPRFRVFTTKTGKNIASAYDPKESRNWKDTVAAHAMAAGVTALQGSVQMVITAYLPRPQRLCRKKDPVGPVFALCKPDVDNLTKGICDALIGIAYADDAQVSVSKTAKFYHEIGGVPRTVVEIQPVEEISGPPRDG